MVVQYVIVTFMCRDSLLGSLTKTLQKRIGSGALSPTGSREDHEDSEFDIKKV